MKRIFLFLGLLMLLPVFNYAQEIKVHNFIGKDLDAVIANYGKPIHQDKSNPEMICTFFRLPGREYTFVSDSGGVYQANASINYDAINPAMAAFDVFMKDCFEKGYSADTLSSDHYKVHKAGCKLDLNIAKLPNSEKYQIKIEAKKTE